MKMKMTRRIVASFLAILAVLLFSIFSLNAEEAHKAHKAHNHGEHAAADGEKVRCAVDGMMMKPSAMIKVEQDGKAYYFCNDMQAEMFKANPDKYLQTISVGNLTFDLNVITTEAYKMMMSHMGMGGMIKADEIKGKTHYFSIYPTQEHGEIALGDVKLAIQVTNTEGETKMALLKYSKMTRTYQGFITMPTGTEHEVRVRVTSPAVKISL
ncbi:YHS domain-containing protein [Candidatus Poribacteria bacterium]|nr:YHS domain-containing protein [Candidatus Poribacteria bacterium]